jgi:ribosomal protein L37E
MNAENIGHTEQFGFFGVFQNFGKPQKSRIARCDRCFRRSFLFQKCLKSNFYPVEHYWGQNFKNTREKNFQKFLKIFNFFWDFWRNNFCWMEGLIPITFDDLGVKKIHPVKINTLVLLFLKIRLMSPVKSKWWQNSWNHLPRSRFFKGHFHSTYTSVQNSKIW